MLVGVMAVVALVASGCVLNGSWVDLDELNPPLPGTSPDADLQDVSCPVVDFCLGVGATSSDDPANWEPLAVTSDGGPTVIDTSGVTRPAPPGVTLSFRLSRVGCRAADDCIAIAHEYSDVPDTNLVSHVFTWDGATWTLVPLDLDAEADKDVECATGGPCIVWATGFGRTFLWDGGAWTDLGESSAEGPGSCGGPASCVRISHSWSTAAGDRSAVHWDGETWTPLPVPDDQFWARAVDCSSPSRCVAVGASIDEGRIEPSSALWDGANWTMADVPSEPEGELLSVSCVGGECVALGYTFDGGRSTRAFTGDRWYAVEEAPGGPDTFYYDLSCLDLSCVAVGTSGPPTDGSPAAAEYRWTRDAPG
jgi:hypothetical protein